jgi:hypothetical protein
MTALLWYYVSSGALDQLQRTVYTLQSYPHTAVHSGRILLVNLGTTKTRGATVGHFIRGLLQSKDFRIHGFHGMC